MTSRTFPLSRQRRRRIVNKPPPLQSPQDLGDALEREPSARRSNAGLPTDTATHEAGARPSEAARLPHEHDEHADAPAAPRPVIEQAEADVEAGLEDTDCRGSAGLNARGNRKPHCP